MRWMIALGVLAASPVAAADRTLTLTDFDRVRVDGGFVVEIVTGRGAGGRISGSPEAIDRAEVSVQGHTLIVRKSNSGWGGFPGRDPGPATIRLTAPALNSVWVTGPATVTVDRIRGLRIGLSLEGSGSLTVGAIEADHLDIGASGSGRMTLAGRAGDVVAAIRGSGDLAGEGLVSSDLKLTSETAGTVTLTARRSARVVASGSGTVTIGGTPGCEVKRLGAATVTCGQ